MFSLFEQIKQRTWFFPILIVAMWFLLYLVNQLAFGPPKLLWDELEYLPVAKGVAWDGDWSSRHYTIMGLLKYGYPSHLQNLPLYPIILAGFFKLFGVRLSVAYFSSWLAALFSALLIHKTSLLLLRERRGVAFLAAIAFLFMPGFAHHLDGAMMEPWGIFFLTLGTYVLVKTYEEKQFTKSRAFLIGLLFLLLWSYKAIFIGFLAGAFVFLAAAWQEKWTGRSIQPASYILVFLAIAYGSFALLNSILTTYIFLPVTPYWAYVPRLQITQVYADSLGGFFNDFPRIPIENITHFAAKVLPVHLFYPGLPSPYQVSFVLFIRYFFFLLAAGIVLAAAFWKRLTPRIRVFSLYALSAILSFNVLINIITAAVHENLHRYNMNYYPLFILFLTVIFATAADAIKPHLKNEWNMLRWIGILALVVFYIPLYATNVAHQISLDRRYHDRGTLELAVTQGVLRGERPAFIYNNRGVHEPYVLYPTRLVSEEATNEQFIRANQVLPEPIAYLFLRPEDWLFEQNREAIEKKEPLFGGEYVHHSALRSQDLAVYRHR